MEEDSSLSIPDFLRRPKPADWVAPVIGPRATVTCQENPDRLTDRDRAAIAEILTNDKRPQKKKDNLKTMLAKKNDQANAEAGGRWDSRLARWVTPEEDLKKIKKLWAKTTLERAKFKRWGRKQ